MNVEKLLKEKGQAHVLRYFEGLTNEEKLALKNQIEQVDWELIQSTGEEHQRLGKITPIKTLTLKEIEEQKEKFFQIGKEAIRRGEVGAVLLAGGQGTRLGITGPKGAFNIGVTRTLYIFEQLIRNLQEVCTACDATVPLFVMTSEKNDGTTRAFFEEHDFFGYPKEAVIFFIQEMAPIVSEDRKLLLAERGKLAFSPNGNGGWFASIIKAGLLPKMKEMGIKWLNTFAVDNVLQRIADPLFVGATIASGANCGAKVVKKSCPEERVGVLCLEDGHPYIIEYYEISKELAAQRDESGELLYGSGVILNYLFSVQNMEEVVSTHIPVHVARKKVRYLDENGNLVLPEQENGLQFETLVLDMVKLTGSCLPFEVVREREFAPVKNPTGVDSVESARALLEQNGVRL